MRLDHAHLLPRQSLVYGLLPLQGMATKRPALRAVPGPWQTRGRQLQRDVSETVERHLNDACVRAWTELADRFGRRALFPSDDVASRSAYRATRALVTLLTRGLTKLAVAALVLPPRMSRQRHPQEGVPRLAAIPGGVRRNDQAAVLRPEGPSSAR
jgi:hypothetical protein